MVGVCPDNRISGDKVLSKGTRHVINRAATALRMAATTLIKSPTYLPGCQAVLLSPHVAIDRSIV